MKREAARLFPPEIFANTETPEERTEKQRAALLQTAQNLRELADRGMSVRKYRREADRIEKEARAL